MLLYVCKHATAQSVTFRLQVCLIRSLVCAVAAQACVLVAAGLLWTSPQPVRQLACNFHLLIWKGAVGGCMGSRDSKLSNLIGFMGFLNCIQTCWTTSKSQSRLLNNYKTQKLGPHNIFWFLFWISQRFKAQWFSIIQAFNKQARISQTNKESNPKDIFEWQAPCNAAHSGHSGLRLRISFYIRPA